MNTTFRETPTVVGDYPLDPFCGTLLSLVEPRAATNLIKNSSFETGLDDWTVTSVLVVPSRSDDYQWVGAYSAKIVPPQSAHGLYYSGGLALASGTTYWAQTRFRGGPGISYLFYFADSSGNVLGPQKTLRASGEWEWVYWSYVETSTATRRIYITRANSTDAYGGAFYLDAVQVEADRLTTYLDGSLKGRGREIAYLWTGLPWGSESQRSALTNTGGLLHTLDEYNFVVDALNGLGHAPVENIVSPIAGKGGSIYQRTNLAQERLYDVIGTISGDTLRHLMANRSGLSRRLSPFRTPRQQPIPVLFELPNSGNIPVKVMSHYVDGLSGVLDNQRAERLALRFASYDVDVRSQQDQGSVLPYHDTFADSDYVLRRSASGVWSNPAASVNGMIYDLAEAVDGTLYATGAFTTIGGVSASYIAKYDPRTSTWSALGSGLDAAGRGVAIDANGNVYVVGLFSNAGGSAAACIAMWNPTTSTWSALGSGLNTTAVGVVVAPDGMVYAAGSFTTAGGGAANRIAKWNPTTSTWSALGTGLSASSGGLTLGPDGRVYTWGAFATAGGVTVNKVAVWNGSTWAALSTGVNNDPNHGKFGPDGLFYLVGTFTTAGGNSANKIAVWNGAEWNPLGSGLSAAHRVGIDAYGRVYVAGQFTETGSGVPADHFAVWTLGAWVGLEVDLSNTPGSSRVFVLHNNQVWISYDVAGPTYAADQTTVSNFGTLDAYPLFRFKGPGLVHSVRNWTTGDAIYFDLTLLTGEVAYLDLTPGRISFTSTFRGDILKTILPGSNHGTFRLATGDNLISTFIYGYTPVENGDNSNYFSAWTIEGATGINTDDGRIYITVVVPSTYQITGYRHPDLGSVSGGGVLLASGLSGTGVKTLNEVGGLGLTGTVTVASAPGGADSDITLDVPIADMYWTPRFASIDDSIRTV